MKKTLIALAAVAAATGAMAQSTVTLSGKYAFAYSSTESFAGVKARGFATTDGDVVFAATEDLGGGLKVSADMALRLRGRGAADEGVKVGGRDAKIAMSGGFGRLVGGSVEAGNGIIARASAGAPTIGLDNGAGIDAAGNVDWLAYYTPSMGGFVISAQIVDSIGGPAAGGQEAGGRKGTVLQALYDAGPLSVMADYTDFTNTGTDNRFRISASYDLGMAKIGAGYQVKEPDAVGAANNKQWMMGVSVPMGAITLGAVLANHKAGGLPPAGAIAGDEVKSYELGMNYAFSKRTNLQVAYQNMDLRSVANDQTAFRVRLMHNF